MDGWIEWRGGECPVDGGVIVDVEFECGPAISNPTTADGWDWRERGSHGIIAYRIHKES